MWGFTCGTCMSGGQRSKIDVVCQDRCYLFTLLWRQNLISWPISSQGCSPPQCWDYKCLPMNMAVFMGSGGLNSCSLACKALIFICWPIFPASKCSFLNGSWLGAAFISTLGWVWVMWKLTADQWEMKQLCVTESYLLAVNDALWEGPRNPFPPYLELRFFCHISNT